MLGTTRVMSAPLDHLPGPDVFVCHAKSGKDLFLDRLKSKLQVAAFSFAFSDRGDYMREVDFMSELKKTKRVGIIIVHDPVAFLQSEHARMEMRELFARVPDPEGPGGGPKFDVLPVLLCSEHRLHDFQVQAREAVQLLRKELAAPPPEKTNLAHFLITATPVERCAKKLKNAYRAGTSVLKSQVDEIERLSESNYEAHTEWLEKQVVILAEQVTLATTLRCHLQLQFSQDMGSRGDDLERRVVDWLVQKVGYPEQAHPSAWNLKLFEELALNAHSRGYDSIAWSDYVELCDLLECAKYWVTARVPMQRNSHQSMNLEVKKVSQGLNGFLGMISHETFQDLIRGNTAQRPSLRRTGVRRPIAPPSPPDPAIFEDLDKLVTEVKTVIKNEGHAVVGIVGISGTGKSTTARRVFNEASGDGWAQKLIYVSVGPNPDMRSIFRDCWRQLDPVLELKYATTDELRFNLIDASATVPTLLVLDDVRDTFTLTQLNFATVSGACHPHSHLIVTALDSDVFSQLDTTPFLVSPRLLDAANAKSLFCYHAFGPENSIAPCYAPAIADMLELCNGVPLALKVLGSSVRRAESVSDWHLIIANLRAHDLAWTDGSQVRELCRPGFDALTPHLKERFMDFSAFPCNARIGGEDLVTFWASISHVVNAASLVRARKQLQEMVDKCLVTCDRRSTRIAHDSPVQGSFYIHEVLWSLAAEQAAQIRNGVRPKVYDVSHSGDSTAPRCLQDYRGIKQVSVLRSSEFISLRGWDDQGLAIFRTARMLFLCRPDDPVKLARVLSKFSMLRVLRIVNSGIVQIPQEAFTFPLLRVLDLSGNQWLKDLPESLAQLRRLQTLNLSGCAALVHLPESISDLEVLQTINLSGCLSLPSLPNNVCLLASLQAVVLHGCEAMTVLPDNFGFLTGLQVLDLSGCCELTALPDDIGLLTSLVTLRLSDCRLLDDFPHSFVELVGLENLDLCGFTMVAILPDLIEHLTALKTLDLSRSVTLRVLPDSIGRLLGLQSLSLVDCEELTELSDSIGQLMGLQTLSLKGCKRLKSLPDSIHWLFTLQELNLNGCESLSSLPETIDRLTALQTLDIRACTALRLPNGFNQLRAQQPLHVLGALDVKVPRLTTSLKLKGLIELCRPENIKHELQLQTLILTCCGKLQFISEEICKLGNLRELNLNGCSSLTALPAAITNLSKLTKLSALGCRCLRLSGSRILELTSLQSLWLGEQLPHDITLEDDAQLDVETMAMPENTDVTKQDEQVDLPQDAGQHMTSLVELRICSMLTVLPLSVVHFLHLTNLNLSECQQLETLPVTIARLVNLQTLNLQDCVSLHTLPKSITKLVALKTLVLMRCSSLRMHHSEAHSWKIEDLSNFTDLSHLDLTATSAHYLSITDLRNLESLNLTDCARLMSLPFGLDSLKYLSNLNLASSGVGNLYLGSGYPSLRNDTHNRLTVQSCRLKSLKIDHFCKFQLVEKQLCSLSAMTTLDLSGIKTKGEMKLPSEIGQLSALQILDMTGCTNLKELPDSIGNLSALKTLDLRGCRSLLRLPSSVSQLLALETLDASNCWKLGAAPLLDTGGVRAPRPSDCRGEPTELEEERMQDWRGADAGVLERLGQLKALNVLDLSGTALTALAFNDFRFNELTLRDCRKLKFLRLSGQNQLVTLDLSRCSALETLADVKFDQLTALTFMNISGCTSIFDAKELPTSMQTLKHDILHPDNHFSKAHVKIQNAKDDNSSAAFVSSVLAATGAAALSLIENCVNGDDCNAAKSAFFSCWYLATVFALAGVFATSRLGNSLADVHNVYYIQDVPEWMLMLPELLVLCSTISASAGAIALIFVFDVTASVTWYTGVGTSIALVLLCLGYSVQLWMSANSRKQKAESGKQSLYAAELQSMQRKSKSPSSSGSQGRGAGCDSPRVVNVVVKANSLSPDTNLEVTGALSTPFSGRP